MSGTKEDLLSLHVLSTTEAYASGTRGTVLKFAGGSWTGISLGTTLSVDAVGGRTGQMLAATSNGAAYRFEAGGWKLFPTGSTYRLTGISASATDTWLVGDYGTILSFDGQNATRRTGNIETFNGIPQHRFGLVGRR